MLNDQEVEVMRDTGCSTVVVRHDLVNKENMTGRKETCVLIDGVVKYYPTAIVDLDTPFLQRQSESFVYGTSVARRHDRKYSRRQNVD
jgi:hypothetical protein